MRKLVLNIHFSPCLRPQSHLSWPKTYKVLIRTNFRAKNVKNKKSLGSLNVCNFSIRRFPQLILVLFGWLNLYLNKKVPFSLSFCFLCFCQVFQTFILPQKDVILHKTGFRSAQISVKLILLLFSGPSCLSLFWNKNN